VDLLLCLARALPDVDSKLPLKIMRRLLAAPDGYLLVLYSGSIGREKRARELAVLSDAARDAGMVAFHHGLVQLLAELCSGLANEVEMYVQVRPCPFSRRALALPRTHHTPVRARCEHGESAARCRTLPHAAAFRPS
jgi:hypothetical protein